VGLWILDLIWYCVVKFSSLCIVVILLVCVIVECM